MELIDALCIIETGWITTSGQKRYLEARSLVSDRAGEVMAKLAADNGECPHCGKHIAPTASGCQEKT